MLYFIYIFIGFYLKGYVSSSFLQRDKKEEIQIAKLNEVKVLIRI